MAARCARAWPLYCNRHISPAPPRLINSKPHRQFLILSAGKTQTGCLRLYHVSGKATG